MTELLVPGLVAAAALTLTYLFCIRPMRKGGHCGMLGMSWKSACGDADTDAALQRLRADVADLRRTLIADGSAARNPAGGSDPAIK